MDDEHELEVIRHRMEGTRASLADKLGALEQQVSGTVQDATQTVAETVETVKSVVENVTESVQTVTETFSLSRWAERSPWGLLGGSALAFVLSFTNVPLSLFLATPRAMPLPILMLARLETRLDPGLAALAVLLVLTAGAASLLAWRAAGPRLWL